MVTRRSRITAFHHHVTGGQNAYRGQHLSLLSRAQSTANDSCSYTVSDGKGGADTADVNITVLASVTGQVTEILNASGGR